MKIKITISTLLLFAVLVLAGITHGYNMFKFPYFENDEGVYMSQAWSALTKGTLSPYTYWYDHAPVGWFVIAAWVKLTGGFYTFGYSLHSGRVLMLVLQILNTYLVFTVAKRLTGKTLAAVIASVVFAISPLGIFFHRRILLDNFMTTFALLSYTILLRKTVTLYTAWISAVLLALGCLSKENGIFFFPAILFLLIQRVPKQLRLFTIPTFFAIFGSIISFYFLYAMVKGELFPYGVPFLGGTSEHVSLLGALKYQAGRSGAGGIFSKATWDPNGIIGQWTWQDPVIFLGGMFSSLFLLVYSIWKRNWKVLSLVGMTLGIFYFFVRGGVVYEFYVVPLIPFLAVSLGVFLGTLFSRFQRQGIIGAAILVILGVLYFPYAAVSRSFPRFNAGGNIYVSDQTKAQRDALAWIRENVRDDDALIFDNHFYVDLRDPKNPSGKVYSNSNWYWKVNLDPEIRDGVYQNNPDRIDYIAMTPQMSEDLGAGASPLTKSAVDGGMFYKGFNSNGWSVNIIRSASPRHILDRSWEWYKSYFITNDGRVVDKSDKDKSTSEGQSYAMLRAVWMDDKETFRRTYIWTKEHLLLPTGVFAWRWTPEEGINGSGSRGSAPDADINIALALAFASHQWGDMNYQDDAKRIIQAIWTNEVAFINNKPYVVAGDWAKYADTKTINPSYLEPFAFRVFADITKDLPWEEVVDSSYEIIDSCSKAVFDKFNSLYLPPDWCSISPSGQIIKNGDPDTSSTDYSYNAFRVPFNIALDYQWNQDPRAMEYLKKLTFLQETWQKDQKLFATYSHDGTAIANYEAVAAYAGSLGAFMIDPVLSQKYYAGSVRKRYYEVDGKTFWDDPDNYYTQNWGWFGTGLYSGKLKNLWK